MSGPRVFSGFRSPYTLECLDPEIESAGQRPASISFEHSHNHFRNRLDPTHLLPFKCSHEITSFLHDPQQTISSITSHVAPVTRKWHLGFSTAASLKIGSQPVHCFGFMENVRPILFPS